MYKVVSKCDGTAAKCFEFEPLVLSIKETIDCGECSLLPVATYVLDHEQFVYGSKPVRVVIFQITSTEENETFLAFG